MESEFLFDFEMGSEDHVHTHLLVDFANTFFRGFHAYEKLNQPGEFPVAHLYGPIKMILGIIKKMPGSFTLHFAMEGYPKFRYDLLPSYKEGRGGRFSDQDDEIFSLMKKDLLNALRLVPSNWYVHPDYEADDVIASLVSVILNDESSKDDQIWIMSSDKDLWGLVNDQVTCLGNKSEKFGANKIQEKLGVDPSRVCLHKTFFGDTSDKIPRIPRVPEKVLLPMVQQCGTVDQMYDLIASGSVSLTPNQKSKFVDFQEQARINFNVASLRRHLAMNGVSYPGDIEGLSSYLEERKCPSLVKDLKFFWDQ